jgi:hypothetical protein
LGSLCKDCRLNISTGFPSLLIFTEAAKQLKPGEAIKIIAINRPSGYIGVVNTTAALPVDGLIDIPTDDIILRPPNLKIWAERIYTVEAGLTKDQSRDYTIGFEGSGLTTDTMVTIFTQWLDQDGSLTSTYGFG